MIDKYVKEQLGEVERVRSLTARQWVGLTSMGFTWTT